MYSIMECNLADELVWVRSRRGWTIVVVSWSRIETVSVHEVWDPWDTRERKDFIYVPDMRFHKSVAGYLDNPFLEAYS